MTPTKLRSEIPVLNRTTYMNTGASGPSPTRVVEAVESCLERHEYEASAEEGMYPMAFDVFDRTRAAVAEHLGASADEIALTQSTTDGINRIAAALDWEEGDTVVRTDLEHSAGILPWKRLEQQGVETQTLATEDGRLDMDAAKDAVADAKIVCFSALTWTHGTMLPVEELTSVAHDAGALVLVDAVQCPGQMATDVTEWDADFVAGAGHKWLLGPFGAGFCFVKDGAETDLNPAHIGYRSVEDPNAEEFTYNPGARRLEVGTASPVPYAGLTEGISLIEELGYDTIEGRISELTDRLKDGLVAADNAQLLSPREYESGLVTFDVEDPNGFVERLANENIRIRSLPTDSVRASVHVFNTEDDIDALLEHV